MWLRVRTTINAVDINIKRFGNTVKHIYLTLSHEFDLSLDN